MLKVLVVLGVLGVSACSSMNQYFPDGQVTVVDGVEHLVRPLPGRANTYQAMVNNPTVAQAATGIDAAIYVRNVTAIEQVTGCRVALASVSNSRNQATAC
jgi:hypothetical protein